MRTSWSPPAGHASPDIKASLATFSLAHQRKQWCKLMLCLLALYGSGQVQAQALIEKIQVRDLPDMSEITIALNAPFRYRFFTLDSPHRLVVDLFDSAPKDPRRLVSAHGNQRVKNVRHARRGENNYRLVFDLPKPVSFEKHVRSERSTHFLVITVKSRKAKQKQVAKPRLRSVVVVIDPGHGGKDPGAVGIANTKEKNVVLGVAKALYAMLLKDFGIRPVLTRSRDVYVPLRKRLQHLRKNRADAMFSLHADAVPQRYVEGVSVYTLSAKGASSEAARLLAKRENIYGQDEDVSLAEIDKEVSSIIINMSQASIKTHSLKLAKKLLAALRKTVPLRTSKIQHGNFAVLKAPDSPSVLVELGYISNPTEEASLKSKSHQRRLASALRAGLLAYFDENAGRDTLLGNLRLQEYVVRRNDTLSDIALRMGSTVEMIKTASRLQSQKIGLGQKLLVPVPKTAQ